MIQLGQIASLTDVLVPEALKGLSFATARKVIYPHVEKGQLQITMAVVIVASAAVADAACTPTLSQSLVRLSSLILACKARLAWWLHGSQCAKDLIAHACLHRNATAWNIQGQA